MAQHEKHIITTVEQLQEMVDYYLTKDAWVFDVECVGENRSDPMQADLMWISFACDDRADTIPMGFPNGDYLPGYPRLKPNKKGDARMKRGVPYEDLNPKYDLLKVYEQEFSDPPPHLRPSEALPLLAPMFKSDALKIAHNERYDLHVVGQHLFYPANPYWDTMIAAWLQDTQRVRGGLSLEACVKRDLGGVIKKGVGERIEDYPFDVVAEYGLKDALWEWFLYEYQRDDPLVCRLMAIEMQVLNPVLEMESTGVRIDKERLEAFDVELRREIDRLQGEIWRRAGRRLNLQSPRQKQELFYLPKSEGGLGFAPRKLTKTGEKRSEHERTIYDYSTDADVMDAHSSHPLIADMIEYQTLTKLHGTYVVPYVGGTVESWSETTESFVTKEVESRLVGGRIFGQFKQFGAESGRFSSSNPNLQNIPSRSDVGKRVREAFIADEGHLLVVADYSQIEPRIIASLSGDKTMVETYRSGGDVYQAVADRMSVTRQAGKTLVLAIAYGVGPQKIANDIGCSLTDARDLMDYFARQFPDIGQHKRRVIQRAKKTDKKNPWSETVLGRRRVLYALRFGDDKAERQAYNHLIQGTAADVMKIALVNVHAALPDSAKMLMTVHDEIVITAPEDEAEDVAKIVKQEMEDARIPKITVPLVADVKIAYRWSDAK